MTTAQGTLIEGKTKIVRETSTPHEVLVEFKDTATAFNRQKIAEVPGKGQLNATISRILFERLNAHNLPTCYLGPGSHPAELRYRYLQMIPLEVVIRNFAYGSICKRFGFEEGRAFQKPLVEFFLKDDAAGDPQITDELIVELGLLPSGLTLEPIKRLSFEINELFLAFFQPKGIRCADFKLEFGIDTQGSLCLGDELSPDNFRLRDISSGDILDKDVFRLGLGDVAETYQKLLQRIEQASPASLLLDTSQSYQAEVLVHSRQNILNPESKTILEALHTLGYPEVKTLQAGKRFELTIETSTMIDAEQKLKAMAKSLLSNPVIEDYHFTLKQV